MKKDLIVLCYVNDFIVFDQSEITINEFKSYSAISIKNKDLERLTQFLGIDIDLPAPNAVHRKHPRPISNMIDQKHVQM